MTDITWADKEDSDGIEPVEATEQFTAADCNAIKVAVNSKGDVFGPDEHADAYIPIWDGEDSKTLAEGYEVVTEIGETGSDTAIPTEQAVREALGTQVSEIPYIIGGTYIGKPTESLKLVFHPAAVAFTIPEDCAGSIIRSDVSATTTQELSLKRNGSAFATATFSAGSTTATFVGVETAFSVGDIFTLIAPTSVDATLSGFGISILCSRD